MTASTEVAPLHWMERDEQRTLARAGATGTALDDWQLLASGEDTRNLGLLFERHRDFVFRVAWGVAGAAHAEDVTQEVFLRIARGRSRWRPRGRFTTLLYRITLNTARELSRKGAREISGVEPPEPAAELQAPPEDPLPALRAALRQLPERQREVVVLRYLEGLSTRETARAMGCRSGTVKAHLHRAMTALRSQLGRTPQATADSESSRSLRDHSSRPPQENPR